MYFQVSVNYMFCVLILFMLLLKVKGYGSLWYKQHESRTLFIETLILLPVGNEPLVLIG